MNRELWTALLVFISAALALAPKLLPVAPDLVPWLTYASALIDLALTLFFGYTGIKARNNSKAESAAKS